MAKKRKRRKHDLKESFRKSLRQATHPIPPKKVEKSKSRYDRKIEKKKMKEDIEKELGE